MSIRREPGEGCDHGVVTDKTLPHDVGFQFGDQDSTGVVIKYLLSMSILNPKKKAPTCMLVLFLDVAEGVHRTCSFSVNLLTNIPTATHALTLNQYLLSASVISIILECSQTEVREQISVPSISCHCPLPGRHPKHPLA